MPTQLLGDMSFVCVCVCVCVHACVDSAFDVSSDVWILELVVLASHTFALDGHSQMEFCCWSSVVLILGVEKFTILDLWARHQVVFWAGANYGLVLPQVGDDM